MAAVAYSFGPKANIHTGGRFTANMEDMVERIGKHVSSITPARANALQGKKLALQKLGEKLPRNEEMELRSLLKEVYRDPEYRRLMEKKGRWSDDYLHKVSSHIVGVCADRRVQVIVIGRNKGWKQEVNMGTEQNRLFCQIAHARLIEFIRYKAEAHGIAVVTTEESYTSKTSFVNGDRLECFADKERGDAPATRPVLTGRRSSVDRNWFHHKNRDDRWKWVHADVNGAFNIIRKVFLAFKYHIGLTLKFSLLRVSPRLGVTPLRLA
jgi:IS605 OrfB family transposase